MNFSDRLDLLMKQSNVTQEKLADVIGGVQSTISGYVSGKRVPPLDIAFKMASFLGVSTDYLMNGGEYEPYKVTEEDMGLQQLLGRPPYDYVKVRFYEGIKVSAGNGIENDDTLSPATVPVLRSFIQPYNPNKIRMLEVTGDSMIDIKLNPGDLVFFIEIDNPSDGLHVLRVEGKLFVKRVEFDMMGKEIKVISENAKYPPKIYRGEEKDHVKHIGKVIGWIHKHAY